MKKVSTLKQIDKKLLQKLDIFVNELRQDFVLVGNDTDKDVKIIDNTTRIPITYVPMVTIK